MLTLQHARDNRELVWDVVSAQETEDFYELGLSYPPARGFRGRPGVEQFTIDKTEPIEFRQGAAPFRCSKSRHNGFSCNWRRWGNNSVACSHPAR